MILKNGSFSVGYNDGQRTNKNPCSPCHQNNSDAEASQATNSHPKKEMILIFLTRFKREV